MGKETAFGVLAKAQALEAKGMDIIHLEIGEPDLDTPHSWLPAASVPCGFSSDSVPIGLQIVGRRKDEATVLRASAAFEEARPWLGKRPPIS